MVRAGKLQPTGMSGQRKYTLQSLASRKTASLSQENAVEDVESSWGRNARVGGVVLPSTPPPKQKSTTAGATPTSAVARPECLSPPPLGSCKRISCSGSSQLLLTSYMRRKASLVKTTK
eukprot:scaffold2200_cov413-Prasinococcus_capsulatus_cf.AAC.10